MDTTWTVPKNIRQIGEAHAHYAIYIEDYVATYIKQVVRLSEGGIRQGLLVGKVYPEGEKTIFVIQGIVTDKELYRTRGQLFSEEGREELRGQCEQFFSELDVIGEVIFDSERGDVETVRQGMLSENTGVWKLLLDIDYSDDIQKFYVGSQGAVEVVESYYIYYDRNEAMQKYLIAYNEETRRKVEEVHDVISGQARAAMGENRRPRVHIQKDTLLICATCMLLICVSLMGIININQYQKMCEMQDSFNMVLTSLGLNTGDTVPATSDHVLWDGANSDVSADTWIVSDITPEDGLASGDTQDGLFDGLPIYVSDVTGDEDSAFGQDIEGNEENGEHGLGQTADGNGDGVPDQGADGNEDGNESVLNANDNEAENVSGQNEGGNGTVNVSGQDADGNETINTPNQSMDGSETAGASGQNEGGTSNEPAGDNGISSPGAGTQQNVDDDNTLAMGGVGENGSETYREYTIKKGDTLTSISMLFYQNRNMIDQICELNGIKNADNIVAGQKILLP